MEGELRLRSLFRNFLRLHSFAIIHLIHSSNPTSPAPPAPPAAAPSPRPRRERKVNRSGQRSSIWLLRMR